MTDVRAAPRVNSRIAQGIDPRIAQDISPKIGPSVIPIISRISGLDIVDSNIMSIISRISGSEIVQNVIPRAAVIYIAEATVESASTIIIIMALGPGERGR